MIVYRSTFAREWVVIALMTVVGAILRFWAFGRLSLTHFDEGIYAFSGLWILAKDGPMALDPSLIAYAPPGFPLLVGLSYMVFGVSDSAAIVVAVVAGIVTIPVIGWLGRRTFGPGAGSATATFAALVIAHVAFSRKALTDVPFLLAWLVAIGTGARFLERPGLLRALVLGVAVGVAQNFKYNGWLAGVTVALAALAGSATDREERRRGPLLRTFGWGLLAALTAGLIYAPWYCFVETHGGYAALVRHHRGYMNAAAWWSNWDTQLGEAFALSGERSWGALTGFLAWFLFGFSTEDAFLAGLWSRRGSVGLYLTLGLGVFLLSFQAYFPWWVGLGWTPRLLTAKDPSHRLLGSWWLVMTILTPCYHPYARLWLPLHALGWLLMAGVIVQFDAFRSVAPAATDKGRGEPIRRRQRLVFAAVAVACGASAAIHVTLREPSAMPRSWVLEPSRRTLRTFALEDVPRMIPRKGTTICVYARRPLAFYLALLGTYSIRLEPTSARLVAGRVPPDSWIMIERDMVLQEGHGSRIGSAWIFVTKKYHATTTFDLDLVSLLDTEPDAAFSKTPRFQGVIYLWSPLIPSVNTDTTPGSPPPNEPRP